MPEPLVLIGAGVIGKRHMKAIRESAKVHAVAIVDPFPGARAVAEEYDVPLFASIEDMLAKVSPSGAIIATPTEHHLAPAMAALNAGLHVLIEKPITATLDEAERVTTLSAKLGLAVLVGHHRRYYPQVETARALIRDGTLGQLVAVTGQWCVRKHDAYYAPDWRKRWQAGPVLTNLIHDMDLMRHICGPVRSIQAETTHGVQGFEKEDAAAITLGFENGALGGFLLSDQAHSPWGWEFATGENAAFPRSGENCMRFAGTQGALEFPNLKLWRSDGEAAWTSPIRAEAMPMDLGDAYIRQIDHFADVIAGQADPRISAWDASQTLRATLAVFEAARTGQRVLL